MGLQFIVTAGTGGTDFRSVWNSLLHHVLYLSYFLISLISHFAKQSFWGTEGLVTSCQRLTPSFPSDEGGLRPVPMLSAGAAPSPPPSDQRWPQKLVPVPDIPGLWWTVEIHGGAAAPAPGLVFFPWWSCLATAVPPCVRKCLEK